MGHGVTRNARGATVRERPPPDKESSSSRDVLGSNWACCRIRGSGAGLRGSRLLVDEIEQCFCPLMVNSRKPGHHHAVIGLDEALRVSVARIDNLLRILHEFEQPSAISSLRNPFQIGADLGPASDGVTAAAVTPVECRIVLGDGGSVHKNEENRKKHVAPRSY